MVQKERQFLEKDLFVLSPLKLARARGTPLKFRSQWITPETRDHQRQKIALPGQILRKKRTDVIKHKHRPENSRAIGELRG